MESRKGYSATDASSKFMPVEGLDKAASVVFPVIASGDVSGAVMLLMPDDNALPGETEIKLTQVASAFLGKQMEE